MEYVKAYLAWTDWWSIYVAAMWSTKGKEKKKSCKFDVDPRNITLKDVQKEPTINYNKLSLVPDHEWYCVNGVTPKPCQI